MEIYEMTHVFQLRIRRKKVEVILAVEKTTQVVKKEPET